MESFKTGAHLPAIVFQGTFKTPISGRPGTHLQLAAIQAVTGSDAPALVTIRIEALRHPDAWRGARRGAGCQVLLKR